jgi:hypothetical protein
VDENCNGIPNPVCQKELAHIVKKLDEIHAELLGRPGHPGDGLVVRVDRLEQTEKGRAKWMAALGTAVIGSLVATVSSLFQSK